MQFPRSSYTITILAGIALQSLLSVAQQAQGNPQFRAFTTAKGLSTNHVFCVQQDSNGFLWVGTNEGLNRFDGRDFIQFFHNPADREHSLSGNSVHGITAHGERLFISTNHGVSVFNVSAHRFENELLNNSAFNFASNELINYMVRYGDRWYVGGETLLLELNDDFSVRNNLLQLLPAEDRNTARDFLRPAQDANGNLYFPSCGYMMCYHPATGKTLNTSLSETDFNTLLTSACHTASPFVLRNDELIFSQWSLNPVTMDMRDHTDKRSIEVIANQPAFNGSTLDIFRFDESTLWLAGEYGLASVNTLDFSCTMVPLSSNQSAQSVCRSILRDTQDNIWIASESGLYQWTRQVSHFDVLPVVNSSAQSTSVYAQQFLEHAGLVYYITSDGEVKNIFRIENGKSIAIPVSCVEGGARSIASLSDDEIAVGGWKSLSKFSTENKECTHFDWMPKELSGKSVISILQHTHGYLWMSFGVGQGVLRYQFSSGETIHFVNDEKLLPHQRYIPIANAFDMAEDARGNVWMVRSKLDGKLIKWDSKRDAFEEIKPSNAAAANMNFNSESYCVAAHGNIIWFGVVREGLFRYDAEKNTLEQFTRLDGLPSNDVYSVERDDSNRMWIGTVQGLSCFDYSKHTFINFTELNGLPSAEFNSASLYDKHSGKMFFSCNGHVISFKPEDVLQKTSSPNLFLTSVKVEGQEDALQSHYFYPGENHFDFAFTAVDLMHATGFEYRYQLEGLESEWNIAGQNKTASYANIPPGNYNFIVSVKAGGEWKEGVTLYSFILPEYFFKTWWFAVLLCLLFCTGIYFIYRLRIRRMKQMEVVRSRISRDLHDDIGSALSSIRILSGQNKQDEKAKTDTLQRIHHSSQKMLDDMDDIIWTINPQNDKVEHLFTRMREFAGELLEAAGINYTLNFDDELESVHFNLNQKRNVYLIFKEALNNAVKYSEAKTIDVGFEIRDKYNGAVLSVKDDGVGFNFISEASSGLRPPSLNEKGSGNEFFGNGLLNMKSRAEEINGKLDIESQVGTGTTIRLHFPL
ncbi:MAG: two-component regulator propeller domain-containing protein [Flavobacteriales bacterium]|nr:two-component regulator propeller domain-containing protein [Flavobacteriales bacterium]